MAIFGAQETNEERKSPTPPKPVSSASLRPPPETWSRPPSRNMSAASPVPPHHHPAQQQRQTFSAFRKAGLAQLRRSRLRRLDQFRLNFSWSDGYIHRTDPLEMCRVAFLRVSRRHFKEQLTNCLPISASATSVQERGVHRRGPPLWTRHGGLCQRRDVLHRPGKRSSNMNRTIMIIQMNNVSIMNR